MDRCTECDKPLKLDKIVWLTFDQRLNTYTIEPVPDKYSQGSFPFGATCAERYQ